MPLPTKITLDYGSLIHTETLLKSVYASARINKLLLAGIKGVALGANFNSDVFLSGTSLDDIAASAGYGSLLVVGMNTLLHDNTSFLSDIYMIA